MNPPSPPGAGSPSRSRGWPWWGILGLSVLVLGSALYRWARNPAESAPKEAAATRSWPGPDEASPGAGRAPSRAAAASITPAAAAGPSEAARGKPKEPLYDNWRSAILSKNAEQVLAAERSFLSDRARFHDGLAGMAERDPEERVRSFSTRVLGKQRVAGDVDLFTRLMENDPSPFVRQNAAWALGELGMGDVAGALRRVSEGDSDKDVRAAASSALGRIH
jgi:hypothetical protein